MLIVSHAHTDPAFNLACEEYFFKQRQEEVILLWRNAPAIILGINQNAYAEVDLDFVKTQDIKVIRRLTGGGAVYHDLGNLNFTFISKGRDSFNDFQKFSRPVVDYLQSLGLNASFSGRNDILVDAMKVSGNAQAVWQDRVLHHGTLLFSVSMAVLGKALIPNPLKLQTHAVASVQSRVTNLADHLPPSLSIEQFRDGLYQHLLEDGIAIPYTLTVQDEEAIGALVEKKYGTFAWNIGRAGNYKNEKSAKFPSGIVTVSYNAKGATLEEVMFSGDFFGLENIAPLQNAMKGLRHDRPVIQEFFEKQDIGRYIAGVSALEITSLFF